MPHPKKAEKKWENIWLFHKVFVTLHREREKTTLPITSERDSPFGELIKNNKVMGTRSCIIIKVRREDIGKKRKFSEKALPITLDEWVDINSQGEVYCSQIGKDTTTPVEIKDQYIGIYCHWDGYPEGVGEALKEKFTDYDSVLNLIVGGWCSFISLDKVRHYANRKGMEWDEIKPNQGKTQKEVLDNYSWLEYAYLFDEERGGWLYKKFYAKSAFKKF